MGIVISLLLAAAAPTQAGVQEAPKQTGSRPSIAVQASVTARILAGAQIRVDQKDLSAKITNKTPPQMSRDSSGTLWVEFS